MTTEVSRYGKTYGFMPNRIPFVLVCAECGSAVKDVGTGCTPGSIAIECTKNPKHSGLMRPEKWKELHPEPQSDDDFMRAVLQHPAVKPLVKKARKKDMEVLYGKLDPD